MTEPLGATYLPLEALLRARATSCRSTSTSRAVTRHLINAETLAWMKPTAVLVNTSRGPVVDQAALADALRDGTIWAAALDVTDPEPIPMDDPLVGLDNCLIVPHIASASRATRGKMAAMAAANLIAGVRGEPLPTEVPAAGLTGGSVDPFEDDHRDHALGLLRILAEAGHLRDVGRPQAVALGTRRSRSWPGP